MYVCNLLSPPKLDGLIINVRFYNIQYVQIFGRRFILIISNLLWENLGKFYNKGEMYLFSFLPSKVLFHLRTL